jgi:hypothetical protein
VGEVGEGGEVGEAGRDKDTQTKMKELKKKIKEREVEEEKGSDYDTKFKTEFDKLTAVKQDYVKWDAEFSKRIKASREAQELWNTLCSELSTCTVDSESLLIGGEKILIAGNHLMTAAREYKAMDESSKRIFMENINMVNGLNGLTIRGADLPAIPGQQVLLLGDGNPLSPVSDGSDGSHESMGSDGELTDGGSTDGGSSPGSPDSPDSPGSQSSQ